MSGQLSQLRQLVADRLSADAYFTDIPVFTEKKGDLDNEIGRSLGLLDNTGGKIGLCVIVMAPTAGVAKPNLPGPHLDTISLVVHVEEAVMLNTGASGTGKAASDCAERVAALLHRWIPDGRLNAVVAERNCISAALPAMGEIAYAVRLATAAGLSVDLDTVATPAAASDPAAEAPCTVTLTCATAGAAIFYSLDGSRPSPTAGTLYVEPIAVESACTLRAQAWLAGYLASAELTLAIA